MKFGRREVLIAGMTSLLAGCIDLVNEEKGNPIIREDGSINIKQVQEERDLLTNNVVRDIIVSSHRKSREIYTDGRENPQNAEKINYNVPNFIQQFDLNLSRDAEQIIFETDILVREYNSILALESLNVSEIEDLDSMVTSDELRDSF